VKYSFIARQRKAFSVDMMCQLLGVTRSGFYSHQLRERTKPDDPKHNELLYWVKKLLNPANLLMGHVG